MNECAKFLLRLDGFLQRMKFHIVLLSFLVYNSFRFSWSRSFQGRQHVKWCYVYISCFRTRSARNFFCVSMVSSSASFIGRMKTNENKWNFVKTKTTTPGNNIYTLLITFIAFTSFISSKFETLFFPYKLSYDATTGSYYAWATCGVMSSEYTREFVMKFLPAQFSWIWRMPN